MFSFQFYCLLSQIDILNKFNHAFNIKLKTVLKETQQQKQYFKLQRTVSSMLAGPAIFHRTSKNFQRVTVKQLPSHLHPDKSLLSKIIGQHRLVKSLPLEDEITNGCSNKMRRLILRQVMLNLNSKYGRCYNILIVLSMAYNNGCLRSVA